ncbi:hypothetical protein ABW19_dt0208673 [Dactylella cylindrospora]|nr:hypothetical protein ABW19_dt0208673 [Dactylella cylindrospora]
MVFGLPCQIDYGSIAYTFQRTFGHLLPRRFRNERLILDPHDDAYNYPSSSAAPQNSPWYYQSGYNTSGDQIGRIQAREKEQMTPGNVSGADVYQPPLVGGVLRKGSGSSGGSRKEVRWDCGVVGGDDRDEKGKRSSISRVV